MCNIFRSISGGVKVARLQRGSQTVKTVELVYADIREPHWLVPEQTLTQGGGVTCRGGLFSLLKVIIREELSHES